MLRKVLTDRNIIAYGEEENIWYVPFCSEP